MTRRLTHIGAGGEARMVDVSAKPATERVAVAQGRVAMSKKTLDLVLSGNAKKGDVLGAARIAGIMAAKKTHELIPLCHPLPVSKVEVDITPEPKPPGLLVRATVKVTGQTGVEMEALMATFGRVPHDLRHGQGSRARHAHRGHSSGREARRQVRPLSGARVIPKSRHRFSDQITRQ